MKSHRIGLCRFMLVVFLICTTLIIGVCAVENVQAGTLSGQLVNINIDAPSLKNNILNEPDKQPVVIYLPPSYQTSGKSFPVTYFLPGWCDDVSLYTDGTYQGFKLKDTMDKLISDGKVNEMIVVIPNGRNVLLGSFYVNSPVTGNWEDFIVKDVIGYVDSNYRTIRDPNARGIGGHSMGGFGALNISMKHPDIFKYVYALSPGLFNKNGLGNTMMFSKEEVIKNYLDIEKSLSIIPVKNGREELISNVQNWKYPFEFIFSCSYGAAFSPNTKSVLPITYPYTLKNKKCIKNPCIWKTWESGYGNIPTEVKQYKDNLLKLGEIRFEYGINDEFPWITDGCNYFNQELLKQKIPHTMISFDGQHQDKLGERLEKEFLPFFSQKFSQE